MFEVYHLNKNSFIQFVLQVMITIACHFVPLSLQQEVFSKFLIDE